MVGLVITQLFAGYIYAALYSFYARCKPFLYCSNKICPCPNDLLNEKKRNKIQRSKVIAEELSQGIEALKA